MSSISAGLSTIDRLDRLAGLNTAVHRLDPRTKVLTTLTFVVCVVSFAPHDLLGLLPFALYPVVLASAGGVPFGFIGRILLVVSPFALAVGAFNPVFDREVVLYLGTVGVSGGWVSYASILLRFLLTIAAALLLTATTGFYGICVALEKLRVPRVFVTQLLLLYRYLFVLGDEARRMDQARRLRSLGRRGTGLSVFAQILGQLLLRTVARAQRIHAAMLCRGFQGEVRAARPLRFGAPDAFFLLGWSAAFVLLRLFDIPLLLGRAITGVLS